LVLAGIYRPDFIEGAGAAVSDGRWFEVDSDIEAATRHFQQSVALYREGGFDAPGLSGYRAAMALMRFNPHTLRWKARWFVSWK
jgi:hypothetical protein